MAVFLLPVLTALSFCLLQRGRAATIPSEQHAVPDPGIDWDGFGFGLNGVRTDSMWLDLVKLDDKGQAVYSPNADDCITEMGALRLSPTATVLNYGQALFEGMKAFRRRDGSIVLFRPERNALRMQQGAQRFLLPAVPTDVFVRAADAVVRANARWVPPFGKGALYLRPLLMGTGEGLGVKPSHEATFCVYCSPVGNYFRGGLRAIRLRAVRGFCRAAAGGAGNVKASGNYAPAFRVQRQARERGYDEVLCLDAATGELVEEAGASNFFAVYPNNTIVTPSLRPGTILPGVTRASIIELAEKECGCTVLEQDVSLSDLRRGGACEAFCCGTGASVTPVGSIDVTDDSDGGYEDDEDAAVLLFGDGSPGTLTKKLHNLLLDLQTGTNEALNEKYRHWLHVVDP